jgi:hypothetical protein
MAGVVMTLCWASAYWQFASQMPTPPLPTRIW